MSKNVSFWARSWGVHLSVTASTTGRGYTNFFNFLLVFGFWLAKTSKIDKKFEKRWLQTQQHPNVAPLRAQ